MISLGPINFLKFLVLLLALFAAKSAYAQETVFDVPSADILDNGKVYGELDGTARPVDPIYTFTPRVVVGIGHQIEIGANFNGLTLPVSGELNLSPTIKWRLWKVGTTGWSLYVGDDLFFPSVSELSTRETIPTLSLRKNGSMAHALASEALTLRKTLSQRRTVPGDNLRSNNASIAA